MKSILGYMKLNFLVLTLLSCTTPTIYKSQNAIQSSGSILNNEDIENNKQEDNIQDVKEEVLIGKGMAAKVLGTFGHYNNSEANNYVNLIGQTLVGKIGRPEIKYYFAVLDSDEVNAFAAPGGYIFVTKGLLAFCKNESELAGVIAHEIAHVNQKHMYKEIKTKREVSVGENITRILSRGGSDLSSSLSSTITKGMEMLLDNGLTHNDEFNADSVGVIYSMSSGYNPTSLKLFLSRLELQHGLKLSKTHPPFPIRLEKLQKTLDENNLSSHMSANEKKLESRFNFYLKGIR